MGGAKPSGRAWEKRPGVPATQKSGTKAPWQGPLGQGPGDSGQVSERAEAQPPCPDPHPAGGKECVGPTSRFRTFVRLAMGLQTGAEFPLMSQDLPGPATLGPGEC